jgi:hypothetical protein
VLPDLGSRVQANGKTCEGGTHPDRTAQCEHRKTQAKAFLATGEPVISGDAKTKERVGDFTNPGREWCPQGEPEYGRVEDVPIAGLGRATPYSGTHKY